MILGLGVRIKPDLSGMVEDCVSRHTVQSSNNMKPRYLE
jgi:hypothetical protein